MFRTEGGVVSLCCIYVKQCCCTYLISSSSSCGPCRSLPQPVLQLRPILPRCGHRYNASLQHPTFTTAPCCCLHRLTPPLAVPVTACTEYSDPCLHHPASPSLARSSSDGLLSMQVSLATHLGMWSGGLKLLAFPFSLTTSLPVGDA